MTKTMAISYAGKSEVSLWCDNLQTKPDGTITFDVINGGWSGEIWPDGTLFIGDDPDPHLACIIWEGTVPKRIAERNDYNGVMAWIQKTVDRKPTNV